MSVGVRFGVQLAREVLICHVWLQTMFFVSPSNVRYIVTLLHCSRMLWSLMEVKGSLFRVYITKASLERHSSIAMSLVPKNGESFAKFKQNIDNQDTKRQRSENVLTVCHRRGCQLNHRAKKLWGEIGVRSSEEEEKVQEMSDRPRKEKYDETHREVKPLQVSRCWNRESKCWHQVLLELSILTLRLTRKPPGVAIYLFSFPREIARSP